MQTITQEEKTTIYVGNIPMGVENSDLIRLFGLYGDIVNITFKTEPPIKNSTKKTTAYAYILYDNEKSANEAIRNLNHSKLHGSEIRVMLYEVAFKGNDKNIWVKNLPTICDNRMLATCFEVFGPVLSAKVSKDSSGQSKGYGFVQFVKKLDAKKAIKLNSALTMGGNQLRIEKYESRDERATPDAIYTNLFFKDFPIEKAEEVEKKLNSYGLITSFHMPNLIQNDGSVILKGFGFANYEKPEDAKKVISELHNTNCFSDSKKFYIQRALPKEKRKEEVAFKFKSLHLSPEKFKKNIHVSNIHPESEDEELIELFSSFGKIVTYKINPPKLPKSNYKTAEFLYETPEIANNVIETMNDTLFHCVPLVVVYYKGVRERINDIILQKTISVLTPRDELKKIPAKTRTEIFNSVKSLSAELETEWKKAGFENPEEFAEAVTSDMSNYYSPDDINDMLSVGDSLLTNVKSVIRKLALENEKKFS